MNKTLFLSLGENWSSFLTIFFSRIGHSISGGYISAGSKADPYNQMQLPLLGRSGSLVSI